MHQHHIGDPQESRYVRAGNQVTPGIELFRCCFDLLVYVSHRCLYTAVQRLTGGELDRIAVIDRTSTHTSENERNKSKYNGCLACLDIVIPFTRAAAAVVAL